MKPKFKKGDKVRVHGTVGYVNEISYAIDKKEYIYDIDFCNTLHMRFKDCDLKPYEVK